MRTLAAKYYTTFGTEGGLCSIAWNAEGIAAFQLGTSRADDIEIWRKQRVPNAAHMSPDTNVLRVIDSAIRYFRGERIDFTDTIIDLRGQSEFFVRIYTALRQIPYGQTTTYGELARSVGAGSERAREVGVAMAANPIPLIVPCHRVLAAGGKLSGFSAPGGTEAKAWMLGLEGIILESVGKPDAAAGQQACFEFQQDA